MFRGEEKDLLIKLQQKEETAFAQLYQLHAKRVYAYARSVLKSPELAEDIVQETFVSSGKPQRLYSPTGRYSPTCLPLRVINL